MKHKEKSFCPNILKMKNESKIVRFVCRVGTQVQHAPISNGNAFPCDTSTDCTERQLPVQAQLSLDALQRQPRCLRINVYLHI